MKSSKPRKTELSHGPATPPRLAPYSIPEQIRAALGLGFDGETATDRRHLYLLRSGGNEGSYGSRGSRRGNVALS